MPKGIQVHKVEAQRPSLPKDRHMQVQTFSTAVLLQAHPGRNREFQTRALNALDLEYLIVLRAKECGGKGNLIKVFIKVLWLKGYAWMCLATNAA